MYVLPSHFQICLESFGKALHKGVVIVKEPALPLMQCIDLSKKQQEYSFIDDSVERYLDVPLLLPFDCKYSNSNSTFIALMCYLCQKTDSKAHHTKTLFNIQKTETLQGSAPRRKQKGCAMLTLRGYFV